MIVWLILIKLEQLSDIQVHSKNYRLDDCHSNFKNIISKKQYLFQNHQTVEGHMK